MFLLATHGFVPTYFRELYQRLPLVEKELVEVDGGALWMCAHPNEAARVIGQWFSRTL